MMLDIADNVVIGFASAEGRLTPLLNYIEKPVKYLS